MSSALIVYLKELKENFRDRRALLSSLVMGPLLGPVLFSLMISFVLKEQVDKSEQAIELPVIGSEHAGELLAFLENHNVVIKAAPENAVEAVKNRDSELVLLIPPVYPEQFRSGQKAELQLYFDSSRREDSPLLARVRSLLQAYGKQTGRLRLLARGVDPDIINAVSLQPIDLATAEKKGASLLKILPYLVILSTFIGGMYLAIDVTAGEKERQSLEPLLILPVSRQQIMLGKLMAIFSFSCLALALSLLAFMLSTYHINSLGLGMDLSIDISKALVLFLVSWPVASLAAGLQIVVTSFAKTIREAQTYLSVLMFIPLLPTLGTMVIPVKSEWWMYAIPIFSQNLLINDVAAGENLVPGHIILSMVFTLLPALILARIGGYLYQRESFVFSG